MASPQKLTKKLTSHQIRQRNMALGKLGTPANTGPPANPFMKQGVESTRKLFSGTKLY